MLKDRTPRWLQRMVKRVEERRKAARAVKQTANDNTVAPPARIELHHADCLEVLKTLPDGSVNLILTDLPYGSTACPWDAVIPFDNMWAEVRRVLKPLGTFITTAANPFAARLIASNLEMFKYDLVWEKNRSTGFQFAKTRPLRSHELVLVFSKGTVQNNHHSSRQMTYRPQGLVHLLEPIVRKNRSMGRGNRQGEKQRHEGQSSVTGYPRSVIEFDCVHKPFHPTQKPLELFDWLVRTYSDPDDVVLDPCIGSGTTGVACVQQGRRFIGIERDQAFFEYAKARIISEKAMNNRG